MSEQAGTPSIVFEPDFSAAHLGGGKVVKFTRLEKRALAVFSATGGRLLTRNQLLDAISEPGSESSNRSVDFLINRIRVKLGDNARAPRFIGTLYGEGYVWLYTAPHVAIDLAKVFVVIGPFRGLQSLAEFEETAGKLAGMLQADFQQNLRPDQKVAIVPAFASSQTHSGPAISVQLSFFRDGTALECVVTARHCLSNRIIDVQRFPLKVGGDGVALLSEQARQITPRVVSTYWQNLTADGATAAPLPVAMHDAVRLPAHGDSWDDTHRRLRAMKADGSDYPEFKMLWATHLHTKYIMKGPKLFRTGNATCAEDEAEIERLVLASLDFVQGRPEYAAMAAKLLYFVDRGYRDLALELATTAHRSNSGLVSSLAILGQLHSFTGKMDAAEEYLTQAEQLSERGSSHHIYALFMLCQAHMAVGARDKLAVTLKRMYRVRPATMLVFELFFTDPVSPSLRAKAMTLLLKRDQATAMLRQATYLSARLFENPRHRENALLTPVNLFVRRFGPDVVPDEAAIHLPQFRNRHANPRVKTKIK